MIRMCDAFSKVGEDVTLVHPSYGEGDISFKNINNFYEIGSKFDIVTVPSFEGKNNIPNVPTSGEITIWLWAIKNIIQGNITSEDVIFSRYHAPTWALGHVLRLFPDSRCPTIVYEQHQTKLNPPLTNRSFSENIDGVVFIASQLRETIREQYELPLKKTLVAHDGVTLSKYDGISQEQARESLELPRDGNLVVYTGHLYVNKGVEQLVQAASDTDSSVYIVGGYEEDLQRVKSEVNVPENVTFTGFVQPSEIPKYQRASDILVATAKPDAEYYSPLKLFEYMAAGKPIVATYTDAFAEVLTDDKNCIFVSSGDSKEMAEAIEDLLSDTELRTRLGESNCEAAKQYSWTRRAERISEFIESKSD